MKVRELLSDESKWTTKSLARDATDYPVPSHDPRACKWCLVGAVRFCYQQDWGKVLNRIYAELSDKTSYIGGWNDSHSFKEVKELAERLDI